jgi:uncharacterized protein (DUF58 family)
MPTPRGYLVILTALGIWGAGRALGAPPLDQIGFALLCLVAIAIGVVRFGRHEIKVERHIRPERARSGAPVTVTLRVNNDGRGHAPLLLLEDRIPNGIVGNARYAVNGIEPGGNRETSFTVTARQRGAYALGPLNVSFIDPFGLARVRVEGAPTSNLLVYPPIEKLQLLRDLGERHSVSSAAVKQLTGARGEDFYTMREYAYGDDLRKVHWPSTARLGKLMLRQEETPWQARATVLIDDRDVHEGYGDNNSFERSIVAAASLVDLYQRVGYTYRLTGAVDPGVPSGKGQDHHRRCLDLLATMSESMLGAEDDALAVRLAELSRSSHAEAALVVACATPSPEATLALVRSRARYRQVTAVIFPSHRFGSGTTRARWEGEAAMVEQVGLLARSGIRSLVLGPDEPVSLGWNALAQGRTSEVRIWGPKPELV